MCEAVFYLTGDKNEIVSGEQITQGIVSNNKDLFTLAKESKKLLETLIEGNGIIRYPFYKYNSRYSLKNRCELKKNRFALSR